MTIDSQRWDNLKWTRQFLRAVSGQEVPEYDMGKMRVPKQVRMWAHSLLKHYPEQSWLDRQKGAT